MPVEADSVSRACVQCLQQKTAHLMALIDVSVLSDGLAAIVGRGEEATGLGCRLSIMASINLPHCCSCTGR